MSESKGSDEVYCQSCGAVIKRAADICPECGVPNQVPGGGGGRVGGGGGGGGGRGQSATGGGGTSQSAAQSTDSGSSYDTSPSKNYAIAVKLSVVIWGLVTVLLLLSGLLFRGATAMLMGGRLGASAGRVLLSTLFIAGVPLLQFVGWFTAAIGMYGDVQYVDYHVDDWPLNGTLYILGAIFLPILSWFTGAFGALISMVGIVGTLISVLFPAILVGMLVRHLRTRNRLLSENAD